jgi:coenzyme F420 hydrogenase subunit delta
MEEPEHHVGGEPGELRWLSVEELPPGSYRDAHSWDLTEPLERIRDEIDVRVLCCQKKHVSAPEMEIGLTEEVEQAVPKAVSAILEEIGVDNGTVAIHQESTHRGRAGTGCETR